MSVLAAGARMERSDKFRGGPVKGGMLGPEMLTTAMKKGLPARFGEAYRNVKVSLR